MRELMTSTKHAAHVRTALAMFLGFASTTALAFGYNGLSIGMSRQAYESTFSTAGCVAQSKGGDLHCLYFDADLLHPVPKGLRSYNGVPIESLSVSFSKGTVCDIGLKADGTYGAASRL
jgi:hypothetical protein